MSRAEARSAQPGTWASGTLLFNQSLPEYGAVGLMLALLLVLVGLPMIFTVVSAFLTDPFDFSKGFSLSTIHSTYTSGEIWHSAMQTVLMSVAVGVVATAMGTLLAWTLIHFKLPAASYLETVVVVPLFLSPLVGAISWVALAAPRSGVLNELLREFGAPGWMQINIMSVGGIAFVFVFHYIPYGYLFLAGTLRNTDVSLEEASHMCGANTWRTTREILLPLLRSSVLSSILFVTILAAGEFSVPSVLGAQGSFVPLSVHLYEAIYGFPQDYARAAAIGTLLVTVSLTAFYFYRRNVRDSRRFITVTGRGYASAQVDPGKWRIPILAVFGLYAFITVVLPYAALLFIVFTRFRTGDLHTTEFTLRNLEAVLAAPGVQNAIFNTLTVSLVVPFVCVVIGVIIVYMHERLRLIGSGFAMYLATAPIAVSGIVFATGVLVVYVSTPVYATIWIIAIGLGAHYLAHAVRIAGNGLGQLDPSLEEAAQLNGASRLRVVSSIVAPLLRPSLFAAFVLIFVFSVREVNTAILLYSPSSQLLSVLAWNYIADGTVAQAAVVGMLQTIMMIAGIVFARLVLGVQTTRNAM